LNLEDKEIIDKINKLMVKFNTVSVMLDETGLSLQDIIKSFMILMNEKNIKIKELEDKLGVKVKEPEIKKYKN